MTEGTFTASSNEITNTSVDFPILVDTTGFSGASFIATDNKISGGEVIGINILGPLGAGTHTISGNEITGLATGISAS